MNFCSKVEVSIIRFHRATAGIGGYFDGLQAAANGIQSGIELARATAHGITQGGFPEISGSTPLWSALFVLCRN